MPRAWLADWVLGSVSGLARVSGGFGVRSASAQVGLGFTAVIEAEAGAQVGAGLGIGTGLG